MEAVKRWRMMAGIALVAALLYALIGRGPSRNAAQPAPNVVDSGRTGAVPPGPPVQREVLEPIYGPDAPSPIYGPPEPPSRVPLLDIGKDGVGRSVMEVDDDAVRPSGASVETKPLRAVGWDTLELDRGIPFTSAQSRRTRGASGGHAADGRRSLLLQASDQAVSTVYYVDPALDAPGSALAASVRCAIAEAISGMKRGDTIGVVAADGSWALALQPVGGADLAALPAEALAFAPPDRLAVLSPALRTALAAPGVTHVIVIASAQGELPAEDQSWITEQRAGSQGRPRVVSLVVGDGEATPRAEALRNLSVGTSGAFAWLKLVNR